MGFEFICKKSDVELGEMKAFNIGEEKVIIFHLSEGFYATQAKCPHLFAPLEKGTIIDNCRIQCKLHRAEFNIKTGDVEQWANFPPGIQALNFIRSEKQLQTYAVKLSDENVLVDISLDANSSIRQDSSQEKIDPSGHTDKKETENEPI